MSDSYELETSEDLIKECIKDLYIDPRNAIRKWSEITNQTAMARLAYPSQHLASLITGIKGVGTSARGDDLADGSEVKSCSRADQLSECKECGAKVLVWQEKCLFCNSENIKIKTDSHWIFSIKAESELDLLLKKVPRILLMLFDKKDNDSDDIRLRVWSVNPKENYVIEFFTDYFNNNYSAKSSEGKNPAPCNLHPLKYDFYMMKPRLIFHSEIDIHNNEVKIMFWNLEKPINEEMPISLLTKDQLIYIFGESIGNMPKKYLEKKYSSVPYEYMGKLSMKKKILKTYKEKYSRR
jgi:hypothetical protein